MALNFVVSYSFSPSTTISSSQVNTNTSDVANVFTGLEAETKSFAKLKVDATPTLATEVAIKSYVDSLMSYRRPCLQYTSSTTVTVESGLNGSSGQVYAIFPDGTTRTDSTSSHIVLDVSRVAALSGSKQSGLRTGTVSTNTWYAVYLVKATDNTTDFVAVADTVLPLQANFATLNSNFGTSGWVYLGLIRYGDNSGSTGVILSFKMSGNTTTFTNDCVGSSALDQSGTRLANTASATTLAYTYAAGTGTTQIPDNVILCEYGASINGSGSSAVASFTQQASTSIYYARMVAGGATSVQAVFTSGRVGTGFGAATAVTVGGSMDIFLRSFVDNVLGVGSSPLL